MYDNELLTIIVRIRYLLKYGNHLKFNPDTQMEQCLGKTLFVGQDQGMLMSSEGDKDK
jgi:hypothetical protein